MENLFNAIVFDKKKIAKIPKQKKRFSVLYVIALTLMTSLLVIILKTAFFDFDILSQNIIDLEELEGDTLVYRDSVNTIQIKDEQIVLNGENMLDIDTLMEWSGSSDFLELNEFLNSNRQLFSFFMLLYQYVVSGKYLLLFLLLLVCLAYTGRWQMKDTEDWTLARSMTFTSYLLTIPVLVSLLLRLLNFKSSLTLLIIVALSVMLEFLFVKDYMKEKGKENEAKEMVA